MFCKDCGKENKDSAKFCIECGAAIKHDCEIEEGPKQYGFLHYLIIFLFGIICMGAIVLLVEINSVKNKKEEADKGEVLFDTEGNKNEIGNSFANLGYQCAFSGISIYADTGRVTGQDGKVYFYEQGFIYEVDNSGNKRSICQVQEANYLNVIGNTLYYLRENRVYAVNIKDGKSKVLLENVLGPYIVSEEAIYYVTKTNTTATVYEYSINKYYLHDGKNHKGINVGEESPLLVSVNPKKDVVTYSIQREDYIHPSYSTFRYDQYDVISENFNGERIIHNSIAPEKGDTFCFVLPTQDYTYIIQDVYAGWSYHYRSVQMIENASNRSVKYIESADYLGAVRNCYNNDLIVSDWNDGKQRLYIVSCDEFLKYEEGRIISGGKQIIEENEGILEVYVIGEYVYYILDSYNEANVYRVKIDGTNWEDI